MGQQLIDKTLLTIAASNELYCMLIHIYFETMNRQHTQLNFRYLQS